MLIISLISILFRVVLVVCNQTPYLIGSLPCLRFQSYLSQCWHFISTHRSLNSSPSADPIPTEPFMSPLFVLNTSGIMIYLVYVDDNIITGDNDGVVQKFILNLTQWLSLKNLELLSYFLSVEVTHHCHGIFLFQRRYIGDLLACTRMLDAKPITTPFATSPTLELHTSIILCNPIEYQTIIGSLHYLSLTQLGIAFKVNKLS